MIRPGIRSLSSPIIIVVLNIGLIWLKRIQSTFNWMCVNLLDALQSPKPVFQRCLASADSLLWGIRVAHIVLLLWIVAILVDKQRPWWIKAVIGIAWLVAGFYLLEPD